MIINAISFKYQTLNFVTKHQITRNQRKQNMARAKLVVSLAILTLILYVFSQHKAVDASAAPSIGNSFIRSSCGATTYPNLCISSLSAYASTIRKSPRQLVTTALSVSIDRAKSSKQHIQSLIKFHGLKRREYAALKDCLEEITEGVDRLAKSVQELKKMGRAGGPDYFRHMSNLQTWVSAALTDDSTCMDGFAGRAMDGRIKTSVRARMTNVAQVTSNALALCNQFSGKF
ncbi:21 kDa protein-like [Primulina tabacum]|uniref:21 kDa protein-like n=1 Tax=Primulina tabacum TaxID=48773 RepID=UPI003F5A1CCF